MDLAKEYMKPTFSRCKIPDTDCIPTDSLDIQVPLQPPSICKTYIVPLIEDASTQQTPS